MTPSPAKKRGEKSFFFRQKRIPSNAGKSVTNAPVLKKEKISLTYLKSCSPPLDMGRSGNRKAFSVKERL